jgi:hypothetical protein
MLAGQQQQTAASRISTAVLGGYWRMADARCLVVGRALCFHNLLQVCCNSTTVLQLAAASSFLGYSWLQWLSRLTHAGHRAVVWLVKASCSRCEHCNVR